MNCREYCPYKEICRKAYPNFKGEERLHHSDCPMAWRIEDLIQDGRDAAESARLAIYEDAGIPFDDIPEGEDTDEF